LCLKRYVVYAMRYETCAVFETKSCLRPRSVDVYNITVSHGVV
jgi:hypothetical protein